jgi:hypothetical protein
MPTDDRQQNAMFSYLSPQFRVSAAAFEENMTFPITTRGFKNNGGRRCYSDDFSQSHYHDCSELLAAAKHFDNPDRAILNSAYRAK